MSHGLSTINLLKRYHTGISDYTEELRNVKVVAVLLVIQKQCQSCTLYTSKEKGVHSAVLHWIMSPMVVSAVISCDEVCF